MSLRELQGLGPASEAMLRDAGIDSAERLRALGAVDAFLHVRAVHPDASLNLLWALEGAITGEPWQTISRVHRTSLLLALEDRERHFSRDEPSTGPTPR